MWFEFHLGIKILYFSKKDLIFNYIRVILVKILYLYNGNKYKRKSTIIYKRLYNIVLFYGFIFSSWNFSTETAHKKLESY